MSADTAKPKRAAGEKAAPDDGQTGEARIKRDAVRYEALAREYGADLSKEGFNAAPKKVGRRALQTSE